MSLAKSLTDIRSIQRSERHKVAGATRLQGLLRNNVCCATAAIVQLTKGTANKWVLRRLLNIVSDSDVWTWVSKYLFHAVGPATEKNRFPTCSHVRGTSRSPRVKDHTERLRTRRSIVKQECRRGSLVLIKEVIKLYIICNVFGSSPWVTYDEQTYIERHSCTVNSILWRLKSKIHNSHFKPLSFWTIIFTRWQAVHFPNTRNVNAYIFVLLNEAKTSRPRPRPGLWGRGRGRGRGQK